MSRKTFFMYVLSALLFLTGCHKTVPFSDTGGISYLKGYGKSISGEVLRYHSPQPEATDALLVRSLERNQYIEWETAPVPETFAGDTARFLWLAAIDVNKEQHRFDLFMNGDSVLSFRNPPDQHQKEWLVKGEKGIQLLFRSVMVDKHGDLMGYMTLSVPAGLVKKGTPLRLKIMGETAGSRVWYMTYRYGVQPKLEIEGQEAVVWHRGKKMNMIRVDLVHLGDTETVEVKLGKEGSFRSMAPGLNTWRFYVPVVKKKKRLFFGIRQDHKVLAGEYIEIKPVQEKTIYLLHHSHVDIGYTQVQAEVQRIQWNNLERALRYAKESANDPEEARFRWNTEGMWPMETYLHHASKEKRDAMIDAIKKGWIELNALYANELTGLCRPEELMRLVEPARRLADSIGVPLNAAMISDVPGYTWGLVPVLAHNGVRYLSIGTNTFDRIGHIIPDLGDKPFYWESPSGKGRVLCWVHGKGYSMFHGALENHTLENALRPKEIFAYLKELKEKNYPYDMVALRYNIGSDNGPPDSLLPEAVKKWNEKYVSPKMVITTVSRLFGTFEKKYGKDLPVLRGDLTPYWSDGAYSSARETEINSANANRIVQASTLFSMFHPDRYPEAAFYNTWKNILLYDEHTWGSWNSISEPESPFTLSQWAVKRNFAIKAGEQTNVLLKESLSGENSGGEDRITVLNTLSWKRSGRVTLPNKGRGKNIEVTDEHGRLVPCQRNRDGRLVIYAREVPAFGWKTYRLHGKAKSSQKSAVRKDPWVLENDSLKITVDRKTGSIVSLLVKDSGAELSDTLYGQGLNGYVYVRGRKPDHPQKPAPPRLLYAVDGPVYQSVVLSSGAAGTNGLQREIRLYRESNLVEIINTVDKKKIYFPESVFFTFPFRLPEGRTLMDIAWGAYRPETDQLPGACRNYFTVQNWVDVSDEEKGITWFTPDARMVELGRITTDANLVGWLEHVQEPRQNILSYVMNNYWGTNYLAAQVGKTVFRYFMIPHKKFDRARAKKQGMETGQPLLAISGAPAGNNLQVLPVPENDLMVTWVQPLENGWLMRLFNPSGSELPLRLSRGKAVRRKVYVTDPLGVKRKEISGELVLKPLEIVTLQITEAR